MEQEQEQELIKSGYTEFDKKAKIFFKFYEDKSFNAVNHRVIFSHIVITKSVKIFNYNRVFSAMDTIVQQIATKYPDITATNGITLTLLELRKGVRFVPDIKIIAQAKERKEKIKTIKAGGMVIYFPQKYKRLKIVTNEIIKVLSRDKKLLAVSSLEEAREKLQEFALDN